MSTGGPSRGTWRHDQTAFDPDGNGHVHSVHCFWLSEYSPMNDMTATMPGLLFTDAAARKVGELIAGEGNPQLKLRVFVSGGGCSGFQYGFTFDESIEEGDVQFQNQGVTLLVDPMSIQYLVGAEIDYRDDLEGAQFVIRNPNASTTCGCGSSFNV